MNSILVIIALVYVVATLVASTPLDFTKCGSGSAKIVDVRVENCSKLPCVFKRGTNISLAMDFIPAMDVTSAHTRVSTTVYYFTLPHYLPDPNACHFMKCPIKTGDNGTYQQSFEVLKAYPAIPYITIEWQILSEQTTLTCFRISARVE